VFRIAGFVLVGVICVAAQRDAGAEQFLGTWVGTWDGAGSSGGFDLIVERANDGPIVAKVSVTGEPTYKATLSQVAFDSKKMTGKYEFPPSPEAEIVLVATFEGNNATGTWSLREKASGTEVVAGNWNVTKK
jgi:hypothetical protein